MKSTFRILFYAKWEASDEAKMLPIYVRITINGTKARFSLKIRVSEKIWDAKSGRAIGHSHEALQANRYLDSVVTRINTIYYRLCEQSEAVTHQIVQHTLTNYAEIAAPIAPRTLSDLMLSHHIPQGQ